MSKYAVGDRVLIEMVIDDFDVDINEFWVSHKDVSNGMWLSEEYIDKYASKTYEEGLNDAWELIKKLYRIRKDELYTIFDTDYPLIRNLIEDFTPQEAFSKIEAYEESKAIKVGDVVECFSDYKGVVLDCDDGLGTLDVFSENGCVEGLAFSDVKKTGRHIDIEHLLEQIRGDQ